MLFNSFIFFFFLIVVLFTFYNLPNSLSKKLFLIAASYFFYGYWDWRFCSLLLISTIVDYHLGQKIHDSQDEKKRKRFLWLSVATNLSILGFFKYFNFFTESLSLALSTFGFTPDLIYLQIILPVGISFYTFQTMSYTIDIYYRKLEPTTSFWNFALFVSFFPQLVAGPIERARNLLPQLESLSGPSKEQVIKGIHLIVTGLFMKVIIGDTAGRISDQIFGHVDLYASPELIAAPFLMSFQFYADWVGYSSIARGLAKLLGIELMKNFEQPYLSASFSEFWQRWHISLSSWLNDYIFTPLAIEWRTLGTKGVYLAITITFLASGLWHGAGWNFVIWGGMHASYLILEKLIYGIRKKLPLRYKHKNATSFLGFITKVSITYLLFVLTLPVFRLHTLSEIQAYLLGIVQWESSPFTFRLIKIVFAYVVLVAILDIIQYYFQKHTFLLLIKNKGIQLGLLVMMFFISLLYMFQSIPLPFVYFQF